MKPPTKHHAVVVPVPGRSWVIVPAKNNFKLTHRRDHVWMAGRWVGRSMFTVNHSPWETCGETPCSIREICFAMRPEMVNTVMWATEPLGILFDAIDVNLEVLCHEYREGISIDLHSSGDFRNLAHAEGWAERLNRYPSLLIWGNTAHSLTSGRDESISIAKLWDRLNRSMPDRVAMRFSSREDEMGSVVLDETTKLTKEEAVKAGKFVCPAPEVPCSRCGFCPDSTDTLYRKRH